VKLEEAIDGMQQATDAQELFRVFTQTVGEYGYDRVTMALLSDHPRFRQSAQFGVLSSYPEDWVEYYLEQAFDKIDPLIEEAKKVISPFTWKQILAREELTKRQRLMFHEASADAHLHEGVGIPLHGPEGTVAGIGVATSCKGMEIHQEVVWAMHNLSLQFYACYWRLNEKPSSRTNRISLTPREIEILQWLAVGLTKAEIADRLRISYHTVDYHVRRLLTKFNTSSITAAVHFATAKRYITLG
jgi:DNA-binding CsgD family transcriptional regulator